MERGALVGGGPPGRGLRGGTCLQGRHGRAEGQQGPGTDGLPEGSMPADFPGSGQSPPFAL